MAGKATDGGGLRREIGLFQGTALNVIDMVGIGPFVTLPLILAAMGGGRALGRVASRRPPRHLRRPRDGGAVGHAPACGGVLCFSQ